MEVSKHKEFYTSEMPLVIGVFIDGDIKVSKLIDNFLQEMRSQEELSFELGKINKIPTFQKISNRLIYLVGLGKEEEYSYKKMEEALSGINYKLGKELMVDVDSFCGD